MPTPDAVWLAYLLFVGALAVTFVLNLWAQWRVYRESPNRRPHDVSHEHRPVPLELSSWANELGLVGYERLGEIELELPSVGILGVFRSRTTRHTGWIRVDRAGTTTASIVPRLVEFSTQLADGTFVETMYPIGHTESLPGVELRHVTASVADAHKVHQYSVENHSLNHGEPRPVETMAAYLRQDADFRQRHALAILRTPFIRRQLLPATLTVGGMTLMVAFAWWVEMRL